MASTWSTPAATSCSRSSGGVSISSRLPWVSINAPVRVRRSRGSADVQVGQRQPICGTPNDVPVPSKVSRTSHYLDLDEVRAPRDVPWDARRHHDTVTGLRVLAFEDEIAHDRQHRIVAGHLIHEHRNDAPHEGELAVGGALGGDGKN